MGLLSIGFAVCQYHQPHSSTVPRYFFHLTPTGMMASQPTDMNLIKCSLVLLVATYFTSCSQKTQLYETKSNLPLDQSKSQYIFDNDTLRIEYNFWANKGVLSYKITNKLDVPVYIDWKKSSFIQNGQKFDYWSDIAITNSSGYNYNFYRNLWLYEGSSVTVKPERVTFLAPKSFIMADRFIICPVSAVASNIGGAAVIDVPGIPGKSINVKEKEYDQSGSPLAFRNFLTYSFTEQLTGEKYINNSFYVSKVIEMKRMDFFNKTIEVRNRGTFAASTFINPSFFYMNL